MKTIKLSVSDAIYAALVERSRKEGQTGHSVASTVRRAVRYWLSKNGHHATELDKVDNHDSAKKIESEYAEGAQSGMDAEVRAQIMTNEAHDAEMQRRAMYTRYG